jgi:hypothetical protein
MPEYTKNSLGEVNATYTNAELLDFANKGIIPPPLRSHSNGYYEQEKRRKKLIDEYGSVANAKNSGKW